MRLRIAIDLHKTLDKFLSIQDFVIENIWRGKHKIYVLSGSPEKEIRDSLYSLFSKHESVTDVSYILSKINILSVVDTCKAFNIPMIRIPKDGGKNWYCDDSLWWPMKAIICKENNIDVLLDDKPQYLDFFGSSHKTKMILITEENIEKINLDYITDALKNSYK